MDNTEKKRDAFPFIWLAAAAGLTAADQITKVVAANALPDGRMIPLIPGVLELTLVHNTGAAFGLGQGGQWLFVALAFLISAVLVSDLIKRTGRRTSGRSLLRLTGETMVLAGAVGNAIDRIRLGWVIDFIYVRVIDFPVFNVADICVTVGCVLMILGLFTERDTVYGDHC